MYQKSFYISIPQGNNAFSFDKRKNKKLFIPELKTISHFDEIELGEEIAFEDFDFDGNLLSCKGLKNFYKLEIEKIVHHIKAPIYLFDNHNHALYFWYQALSQKIISKNCLLYHIDEHADMREPQKFLGKKDFLSLEKIFEYTNFEVNVGNYIVPAMQDGLIEEVIQIRSEEALMQYDFSHTPNKDIILNLDLDFFEPNLDYIDFELKKSVILDIAKKAKLITISTSPFFIDQKLALKVLREIFG